MQISGLGASNPYASYNPSDTDESDPSSDTHENTPTQSSDTHETTLDPGLTKGFVDALLREMGTDEKRIVRELKHEREDIQS